MTQREQTPLRQRPWALWSCLLVAAGLMAWVGYQHFLSKLPPCLFHRATGLLCPGCGGRRCITMLSQGRLLDAMQMNALLMGLCAAFVGLIFRVAWRLWSRHVQPFSMSSWICWVAAGAVVSFWVLRNLPFPPFEWLAPSAHYVP